MLFHSQSFILGFLPAALLLYYGVAGNRVARQLVAIIASLTFYGCWDPRFVPFLVLLTIANWLIGLLHVRQPQRGWVWLGVALNLGLLGLLKFSNFFAASFAALLGLSFAPWDLILPLGISFFVFQKISWLVDLRAGRAHAYALLDFFMFVTFFPQLVAGPIIRHNEIIHQFTANPRGPRTWENISRGIVLFLIGVAKKAGIADPAAEVANRLFAAASTAPLSAAEGWAASFAFTLQIYCDFSGYSDMAIGLGLMFGLRLPFNFNAPYAAASVQEFWRRWHMTLSRFLRDYLYIPLGGNRGGGLRQFGNLMTTMLLAGLWHGANWTFVAWGGLHGLALGLEAAWRRARLVAPPAPLAWALTMAFVMAAWVLFRAPDFATAWTVLRGMAGLEGLGRVKIDNAAILALGAAIAALGPTSQMLALEKLRPRPWLAVPLALIAVALVLLVGTKTPNEFIYFQF